ncbi:glutamic acid-rich protein isoform X2 [Drosophila albomicans]|uniref:Glutamic acid-rich protein isoform X2 n=1 Tax=Drosophila albomicans TaxID=7291 RepID=A0A6P8X552_DROAB|nr:glutamic acid-rich protein isoform X2 [Drosophila albomicans]
MTSDEKSYDSSDNSEAEERRSAKHKKSKKHKKHKKSSSADNKVHKKHKKSKKRHRHHSESSNASDNKQRNSSSQSQSLSSKFTEIMQKNGGDFRIIKPNMQTDPCSLVEEITKTIQNKVMTVPVLEVASSGSESEVPMDVVSPVIDPKLEDELNLEELMKQKALLQARLGAYMSDTECDESRSNSVLVKRNSRDEDNGERRRQQQQPREQHHQQTKLAASEAPSKRRLNSSSNSCAQSAAPLATATTVASAHLRPHRTSDDVMPRRRPTPYPPLPIPEAVHAMNRHQLQPAVVIIEMRDVNDAPVSVCLANNAVAHHAVVWSSSSSSIIAVTSGAIIKSTIAIWRICDRRSIVTSSARDASKAANVTDDPATENTIVSQRSSVADGPGSVNESGNGNAIVGTDRVRIAAVSLNLIGDASVSVNWSRIVMETVALLVVVLGVEHVARAMAWVLESVIATKARLVRGRSSTIKRAATRKMKALTLTLMRMTMTRSALLSYDANNARSC